jgi:hypothetical protein
VLFQDRHNVRENLSKGVVLEGARLVGSLALQDQKMQNRRIFPRKIECGSGMKVSAANDGARGHVMGAHQGASRRNMIFNHVAGLDF